MSKSENKDFKIKKKIDSKKGERYVYVEFSDNFIERFNKMNPYSRGLYVHYWDNNYATLVERFETNLFEDSDVIDLANFVKKRPENMFAFKFLNVNYVSVDMGRAFEYFTNAGEMLEVIDASESSFRKEFEGKSMFTIRKGGSNGAPVKIMSLRPKFIEALKRMGEDRVFDRVDLVSLLLLKNDAVLDHEQRVSGLFDIDDSAKKNLNIDYLRFDMRGGLSRAHNSKDRFEWISDIDLVCGLDLFLDSISKQQAKLNRESALVDVSGELNKKPSQPKIK